MDLVDALPYISIGISIATLAASVILAWWLGAKAAQKYMVKEQRRSEHYKFIVGRTRKAWGVPSFEDRNAYSSFLPVQNVLQLQWDGEEVHPHDSPFILNADVLLFESHLKTGYTELWDLISDWEDRYDTLCSKASKLMEVVKERVKRQAILPEYGRLKPNSENVNYMQLSIGYFASVLAELERSVPFEIRISTSISNEITWYELWLQAAEMAVSPDKDKIDRVRKAIEELHSDGALSKEFKETYTSCEALSNGLDEIREMLESVWSDVDNGAPLGGTCDVCKKAGFE